MRIPEELDKRTIGKDSDLGNLNHTSRMWNTKGTDFRRT